MTLNRSGILSLALLASSCSIFTSPDTATDRPATPDVDSQALVTRFETEIANKLFEDAFEERLARSPERQTYLGIRDNYDKWDDISDAYAVETHEIIQAQWKNISKSVDYEKLSEEARLSYRIFQYNIELAEEAFKYRLHNYPVDQMNGMQAQVPAFLINIHPADNEDDLNAYVARLMGIKPLFRQLITNLKEREAIGIIIPQFVFHHVLSDARNVITGKPFDDSANDSTLLADFRAKVNKLDISRDKQEELLFSAEDALLKSVGPAYEELIQYLKILQTSATTDDGAWKFPYGEDYYAFALRRTTSTDLTADEIHQIGLTEVWRIHGEMIEVMKRTGYEGSLTEFFEFLRTDDRFYMPNTPEGKQAYLSLAVTIIDAMDKRLDELFLRRPRADLIVKAVEPFREKSAGKAFYSRPAPDGSRPGTFYANLYDTRDMPVYELEALAHHEAIPGHHMQLAIASELTDLPRFRRHGRFTAHTEGWALYMEYIPRELGFYSDPYNDFGRLAMELWRACRLVVDTGIHAKKWTRDEAIHYLDEHTPSPHNQNVKAIERYIVMPSQATAYKIGMLKFLELRNRARDQLADQFDIREFHDLVLRNGPMPLSVLEEVVDHWLKGKG